MANGCIRGSRLAVPSPATAAVAIAAAFLLTAVLGTSPARALPPVTGSGCTTGWVNNAAAMACFIQGEDEANQGVKHPHYVACVPASRGGQIYCCTDNDAGAQNCDAISDQAKTTPAQQIQAILGAHKNLTMSIGRYSGKGRPPHSEIPTGPRKAAP